MHVGYNLLLKKNLIEKGIVFEISGIRTFCTFMGPETDVNLRCFALSIFSLSDELLSPIMLVSGPETDP